jgi:hypothetical protein
MPTGSTTEASMTRSTIDTCVYSGKPARNRRASSWKTSRWYAELKMTRSATAALDQFFIA